MDSKPITELLKRTPSFLIVIGAILLLFAAIDDLQIGSNHLAVGTTWRYVLAGVAACLFVSSFVMLLRENKEPKTSTRSPKTKEPVLEPSSARQLAKCGLTRAFRIPMDNPTRLRRVTELIAQEVEGEGKLRLVASSGFSYLNPNGPVWQAGLGKLTTAGRVREMIVVIESPFSAFALTRALANGVEHNQWQDKGGPETFVRLLQYPNIKILVTEMVINCSLFFTSKAVYYDPYLWAMPFAGGRTENNFWVLEFDTFDHMRCKDCDTFKTTGKSCDCYTLLENHFDFLVHHSVPIEEILHTPQAGPSIPRGVRFHEFFKEYPGLALNRYHDLSSEFTQKIRMLKESR